MNRPRTAVAAAVGAGWVLTVSLTTRPVEPDAAATPPVAVAVAAPAAQPGGSLAGTVPDGGARATADDTLLPSPDLIRLFDYYLSTVGERPLADIRAQIERDLDGRLGPNAARQAKDVLARYLGFRAAMQSADGAAAPASGAAVERLRSRWQAMRATRARFFDAAEVAALFGPDDAMAQAAVDRLAAAQDPAASPEERQRRLAALDAAAPAAAQAREASNLVNRINDEARRILAAGGTEDDVYRMRAAAVSPEAANRLAEVDQEEARWATRIAAYLAQRAPLLAAPDAETRIAQLRTQLFTADEQRRLTAYER